MPTWPPRQGVPRQRWVCAYVLQSSDLHDVFARCVIQRDVRAQYAFQKKYGNRFDLVVVVHIALRVLRRGAGATRGTASLLDRHSERGDYHDDDNPNSQWGVLQMWTV